MTIHGLYDRFQKLDTESIVHESLVATKEGIADQNAEQLLHGLRSDGSEIMPEYSNDLYAQVKNRMNPLPGFGVPDLYKTGSFVEHIKVEVGSDKITEDSTDEKSEMLQKKYSKGKAKIFGLSKPYRREYLDQNLRPEFKRRMESATGLKLTR